MEGEFITIFIKIIIIIIIFKCFGNINLISHIPQQWKICIVKQQQEVPDIDQQ